MLKLNMVVRQMYPKFNELRVGQLFVLVRQEPKDLFVKIDPNQVKLMLDEENHSANAYNISTGRFAEIHDILWCSQAEFTITKRNHRDSSLIGEVNAGDVFLHHSSPYYFSRSDVCGPDGCVAVNTKTGVLLKLRDFGLSTGFIPADVEADIIWNSTVAAAG